MKKVILLSILLLTTISFAQSTKSIRTEGLVNSTESRKSPKNKGVPVKTKTINDGYTSNECHKGISYKVKNTGKFSGDDTSYAWWIRFKNNYKKPVAFSYRLLVGGVEYAGGGFGRTYTLKLGENYTNDWGSLVAMLFNSDSDNYTVEIKELCFGEDDCTTNGYAECGSTTNSKPAKANTPTVYSTVPYDSPLNSNNPNYGKTTSSKEVFKVPKNPLIPAKKIQKVIPPFTFPFDKNKEPQDILEELIAMLKNLGYTYETTTHDPLIKGLPMQVFFKEFKVSFSSKLPDYDYSANKYGKRWVEKIWYNPLEGGSVYRKCEDCNELYNKINIEKN